MPRKGEVVKDHDGNLGIVTGSLGSLTKRRLWVSSISGTEIYSDEEAELFWVVSLDESKQFNLERLALKGLKTGALCSYNGNTDVPLEIVYIEWNGLRDIPLFWLKDLRKFTDNILKTDNETLITAFDLNIPPLESIISTDDSSLKWRLQINLIEVERPGWSGSGSVWEFKEKEYALNEIENWKSRLMIRRVASVINSNWDIQFPCWTIEVLEENDTILYRIKSIDTFTGVPAYFPTALHAATALKLLPIDTWKRAFITSHDPFF